MIYRSVGPVYVGIQVKTKIDKTQIIPKVCDTGIHFGLHTKTAQEYMEFKESTVSFKRNKSPVPRDLKKSWKTGLSIL